MGNTTQINFVFLAFISFFSLSYSFPLSTNGRWIVDSAGRRMKLMCVNWPSHTQSMLIEGLDRRPLKDLADEVVRLRFNCVRLTYATHMFTRYANRTVQENFDLLDLKASKMGLALHNPFILNMTVFNAYEAAVDILGTSGLMVIADNHISQPKWCCSLDDGNGFFGDRYFDPEEWLEGLRLVARRFYNKSNVVAMSLRNELRGTKSKSKDWNKYMTQGATTIHTINPNILIIISGLNFDNDLRCQRQNPLPLNNLHNKLVFEVHLYSFSGESQSKFINNPLNKICSKIINGFVERAEFVMEGAEAVPLFVSEFGFDQRGVNEADDRFLSCFRAHLAKKDLDWALWAWQGSYYYRQGKIEPEEVFGVLNYNWTDVRNPHFSQMFQLLQTMLQDPNSNSSNTYVMYHPQSGQCVQVKDMMDKQIYLNNCSNASHWSHEGDGTPIMLEATNFCLKANGNGLPPSLSSDCFGEQSVWTAISDSKLHLATLTKQGNNGLCLEKESSNSTRIVMGSCVCVGNDSNCLQDTQAQWFELVVTNTW
ncbi:glycosyl hydrolase 5 family protein-like [Benincasa hispida]|uniref:glycosyl hydrolase 5 family protein-like n=1 Tax=Benincasa hispida TaxID=102211 RepID=UPI001901EAFD|nr:glycosyl hydrolase 5 family protein-like [Benincasa hispida]